MKLRESQSACASSMNRPLSIAMGVLAAYIEYTRGRERPDPHQTILYSNLMRKIEQQIITAIRDNKDLKVANSEVITFTNHSDVYLHGNLIARIGETWMELFDGGWQTATTKSRLNAILSAFGMPGEYVFQKNFQWFVQYDGAPIPFFSGMRLA